MFDTTKGNEEEQKKSDFLALNPNGKVPLLVIEGTPIFETIAIMSYLGETYGVDKGMYPAAGVKRAEAMKWMAWTQVTMGEALSRYAHAQHERFPKELHHEPSAKKAKADVESLLSMLEAELVKNKRDYLLGRHVRARRPADFDLPEAPRAVTNVGLPPGLIRRTAAGRFRRGPSR